MRYYHSKNICILRSAQTKYRKQDESCQIKTEGARKLKTTHGRLKATAMEENLSTYTART